MTVALKARLADRALDRSGGRLFDVGPSRSLDDSVTAAWAALEVRGQARCLVCGGSATRAAGAEARCTSCGSRLA